MGGASGGSANVRGGEGNEDNLWGKGCWGQWGSGEKVDESCAGHCRSLYGVDLMLDSEAKPWLLEIQKRPDMRASCPQDEELKDRLFRAMLAHERDYECAQ